MKKVVTAIITGLLFLGFTYLVMSYDVAAIGPGGTQVGFSRVNQFVHELTGVNETWYQITEIFGYLAIAVAAFFAVVGLIQMIKRKSLLKVDREIICLGILFIVVMALYMAFEKVIINYRPVVMPGETLPEASYPSSHTMLIITVMGAAMMLIRHYIGEGFIGWLLRLACFAIIFITVIGRTYCGYHWFTDIIGGVLLSITLIELYKAAITRPDKDRGYQAKH